MVRLFFLFALIWPFSLPAQEAPALSIATAETIDSPYLVGPGGRPVYLFYTDGRGGDDLGSLRSCKQRCLTDWPLVPAPDTLAAGQGVDPELIASITEEGQEILVYNSWPLFHFHRDTAGAPPQGHGIHTYGGWWYLVQPSGAPVNNSQDLPEVTIGE